MIYQCTTCRFSNELWKESSDHCGICIGSESDIDFPEYIPTLYKEVNDEAKI